MSETSTLIGYGSRTIGREELTLVPTPPATETHRPIPHHGIVQALIETLGFRHIGVVHDEYAVSPDGMKMFGVLDLATEMAGCRFSIGLRNSHDKSMRLAMTCGYRVFVCSNMAFSGDFTPVLAKHSKSFSLIDCISVGVDRMQRNFEPMRKQVEMWQRSELTDVTAKVVIYEAFVEGKLELQSIWRVRCTTCISSPNTRNSDHGASHESGRRAGTESVLLAVALGAACDLARTWKGMDSVRELRDLFWELLQNKFGDRVVLNGHPIERLPNTLNVSFVAQVGTEILGRLPGVAASTGSACHAGSVELSPVLRAMGVAPEIGMGAIRFSLGRTTTRAEIEAVVEDLS